MFCSIGSWFFKVLQSMVNIIIKDSFWKRKKDIRWIDLFSRSCRSSFSMVKTLASDMKGELHCLTTRSQWSSHQSRHISWWNCGEVGGGQPLGAPMQLQLLPSNFQSLFQKPLFHFASQDKSLLAKMIPRSDPAFYSIYKVSGSRQGCQKVLK